jgi:hypothetical protein
MMTLLDKLKISFDANGDTNISKEKLLGLIQIAKTEKIFTAGKNFPIDCYVLVDSNGTDFYPFPLEELELWQKDGSFEKGDYLYKMIFQKKY